MDKGTSQIKGARIALFSHGQGSEKSLPMGMDFHIVPGMHALYVGPVECARHTFPQLAEDSDVSFLVVDDVRAALGDTENLIREAVAEISECDSQVRAFVLCTACQTAFLGVDFDALCRELHEEMGLFFSHLEANRMSADNIPGPGRKDVPGGDRFHARLALFRLLEQAGAGSGKRRGVLVLTENALDPANELLGLASLPDVGWVRSVGDCHDFGEFLESCEALMTVATSIAWREVGVWMEERFGIPALYLPTDYGIGVIGGYYDELLHTLARCLGGRDLSEENAFARSLAASREVAVRQVEEARIRTSPLELDLRLVSRPFSLVKALRDYGFEVGDFQVTAQQVRHVEADDLPAWRELSEEDPELVSRLAASVAGERSRAHVRSPESSWWGYASVIKLMEEIANADVETGGKSA